MTDMAIKYLFCSGFGDPITYKYSVSLLVIKKTSTSSNSETPLELFHRVIVKNCNDW